MLLVGPSGAGKSDLGLRLLHNGWQLVCDDRVELIRTDDQITTASIPAIRGLLEVRGLGIVPLPEEMLSDSARLVGSINLMPSLDQIDRMPAEKSSKWCDMTLPTCDLYPFEHAAPLKVGLFLDQVLRQERSDART